MVNQNRSIIRNYQTANAENITLTRNLSTPIWQRFVEDHPNGNIFHTPEMFQVFTRAEKHYPTIWAAVNSDGFPVALFLPVNITTISGLPRFSTRAVIYGGVLSERSERGHAALSALLQAFKQDRSTPLLFTEIRNITDATYWQPILDNNRFLYQDHLNYIVDLDRPAELIWKQFDSQARTKIRKAEKSEIAVEEVKSLEQVQEGYKILDAVYRRIQVPLAPKSLFTAAMEVLGTDGKLRFLLAKKNGIYIGVSVNLLYKDRIFGWYAGALDEYSTFGVNELLNWTIIEWGASQGYKIFDFGGAGRPNEPYGPRNFKAKFRGRLVNYGRNIYVNSPYQLKLSNFAYRLYRKAL